MVKEISACESVLYDIAEHYEYLILRDVVTKAEAIDSFRREAYVILLVALKLCDKEYLDEYRRAYNELKNEINEFQA